MLTAIMVVCLASVAVAVAALPTIRKMRRASRLGVKVCWTEHLGMGRFVHHTDAAVKVVGDDCGHHGHYRCLVCDMKHARWGRGVCVRWDNKPCRLFELGLTRPGEELVGRREMEILLAEFKLRSRVSTDVAGMADAPE